MRSPRCPGARTALLALCLTALPVLAPPAASAAPVVRTSMSEPAPAPLPAVDVSGTVSVVGGGAYTGQQASVSARPAGGGQSVWDTVDADGAWSLRLAPGTWVVQAQLPPDHELSGLQQVVTVEGAQSGVALHVRTRNVSGTLKAVDGTPVSGPVRVLGAQGEDLHGLGTYADSGSFSLALADGDYVFEAVSNAEGAYPHRVRVEVRDGVAGPVALQLQGANLVVAVQAPDGAPLSDWTVSLKQGSEYVPVAFRVVEGRLTTRVPDGTYTLQAFPTSDKPSPGIAEPKTITVAGDRTEAALRLRHPRLRATVTADGTAWTGGGHVDFVDEQGLWQPGMPYGTQVSADGSFAVDPPVGVHRLRVTPPSGADFLRTTRTVEVVADGSVTGFALDAADISGTVTLPDGKPAGGGLVELLPAAGGGQGTYLTAAEDGRWSADVPAGSYAVTARPGPGVRYASSLTSQVVVEDQARTRTALVLQAPNLTGTVTAADGTTPFTAGSYVQVLTSRGQQVAHAEVGAEGTFAAKLPPGEYVLRATPFQPGDLTTGIRSVTVTDQVKDVVVALSRPNVRGTVTLPGGKPYTGQGWVSVTKGNGEYVDGASVDAKGVFRLRLDAGTYTLNVQPWQGAGFVSTTRTLDVPAEGDAVADVELKAPNVTGTVTTPKGDLVPNSAIEVTNAQGDYVSGAWAVTDAQGAYALLLDPGTYTVTARPSFSAPGGLAAGQATVTVTEASGSYPTPIVLEAPNLFGTVVDPDGNTVRNVYVEVQDLTRGTWRPGAWSPDGSYALKLPAGKYRLTARPPYGTSGTSAAVAEVLVAENGPYSPTVLELKRPNLTGRVLNGSSPVPHSFVDVTTADGRWVEGGYATAGFDGQYALNLPAGEYDLTARPAWGDTSGAVPTTVRVVVKESATTTRDVALAAANLKGRVVLGDDAVAESFVDVTYASGSRKGEQVRGAWATTDDQGRFALRVPTEGGPFTLTARPSWRNPAGAIATSVPATPGDLALQVPLESANVQGTVTTGAGLTRKLVRGSFVDVRRKDSGEQIAWAVTGEDGSYGLKLPEGSYRLTARPGWNTDGGYAETTRDLVVTTEGADGDVELARTNVSGTVEKPGGGIAAHVPVRAVQGGKVVANAWADANGAYAFALPAGEYELQADPPYDNPEGLSSGSLAATAGSELEDGQDITLKPSTTKGRVVAKDDQGADKGVPNAPVTVYRDGVVDVGRSTATDAKGDFNLALPADGSTWKVKVQPPLSRDELEPSTEQLVAPGALEIELVAAP